MYLRFISDIRFTGQQLRLPAVIKIKVGTLCVPRQVFLLGRYSLVLTHVCVICLETQENSSFIPFVHARLKAKLVPRRGNPWFFHLKYASQVLQIRSQYLSQDNYRAFSLIQSSTITLAYSDEPYTQNYGKFVETPIPRART